MADWIWIKEENYYKREYKQFADNSASFLMAEFINEYDLSGSASLKICADTKYELYVNDSLIARGPASSGGDFETEPNCLTYSYYDTYKVKANGKIKIRVVVTAIPTALCEYSFGYPGFWLELKQRGKTIGKSDKTWLGRAMRQRPLQHLSDYTWENDPFGQVMIIPYEHKLKKCPLEHRVCEKITPQNASTLTVNGGKKASVKLDFPKIYSAYLNVSIKCSGRVKVTVITEEIDGVSKGYEEIITDRSVEHVSQRMFSVGQATLYVENEGNDSCSVDFYVTYVHYPVKNEAYFKSSDKSLNKIYDVCMHTLKICRQDIHLDSPKHQEPLACTGDYYIQALMEYLNIYDPTLTAFDIVRTAEMLKNQKGKMFHTSYSLMFPMWLYDYYAHTGDTKLIKKTKKALEYLFSRFNGYISKENDLVEKAPNYMFVDWIVMKDAPDPYGDARDMMSHGKMDGFSLHHPPKVLGQSVLCMLYYEALVNGARLYRAIELDSKANELEKRAQVLGQAINTHLFDSEKGLYIGGLNTKDKVKLSNWLPENIERTFYLKQANTLAVLFDIAPSEHKKGILDYVAADLRKEEMQPYFYHFLLSALYKENMLDKYGFNLIYRYNDLVNKTDKGLCEAWEYIDCDCSHAWGGTPAYILKKAISGFEIVEPAYKKIKLSPNLYHLDFARFNISTPYGNIYVDLQKGKKPQIVAPTQIEVIIE